MTKETFWLNHKTEWTENISNLTDNIPELTQKIIDEINQQISLEVWNPNKIANQIIEKMYENWINWPEDSIALSNAVTVLNPSIKEIRLNNGDFQIQWYEVHDKRPLAA